MSKKIEPTEDMVAASRIAARGVSMSDPKAYWLILRAALNHPDARGLIAFEFVDSLRAAREQGWDQAVDWIRGDQGGPSGRTTNARLANPYRPAQEPPTEHDGAVLVPADGHESITTTEGQEFSRLTFTTKQSIWYGPNLAALPGDLLIQATSPSRLTPGTWKVADQ